MRVFHVGADSFIEFDALPAGPADPMRLLFVGLAAHFRRKRYLGTQRR